MNSLPLISIITITFNSEKTLEETILSVINQNYPNLEYIIIDGGSKDRTLEIVNKYKDNISIVVSEPDEGISDAFNKGIMKSSGEIVGIINSDDLLLPGALKAIADNYDSSVDVYRGKTVIWDDIEDKKMIQTPSMEFPIKKPFYKGVVCHQSTFIKLDAYKKYGTFKKDLKYAMDVDLLTRFYVNGANFKLIDQPLAVSRFGGVTDSFFMKMIGDVYAIERNNGGTWFSARVRQSVYITKQCIKHLLFKIFGANRVRSWKYKK